MRHLNPESLERRAHRATQALPLDVRVGCGVILACFAAVCVLALALMAYVVIGAVWNLVVGGVRVP